MGGRVFSAAYLLLLILYFVTARAEISASLYSQKTPWSVLVLVSNYSSAGLCSGTSVGQYTILTAGHCLEHADRAIVYTSQSAGGVNATCLLRSVQEEQLFRPVSMAALNSKIIGCGVSAASVTQAALAPSVDAALLRVSQGALALHPAVVGVQATGKPVRALGYGTTFGRAAAGGAGSLFDMHEYEATPLSAGVCASVAAAVGAPPGQQWMCLPNANRTICNGDSGGAVVSATSTASAPVLVAMNIEGTFSLRSEPCLLGPVTLHASVYQMQPWMNRTMTAWGDRGLRVLSQPVSVKPSPPSPPPPPWTPPASTVGSVYVRGVRAGSNHTLWCEGLAVNNHAVVTSAACIGTFDSFLVYDTSCADAVGTKSFPHACAGSAKPAILVAAHPSWAPYAKSFLNTGMPHGNGVDLAVVSTCGSVLVPTAGLTAPAAAGGIARAPGARASAVGFFPREDCSSLVFMFGRPDLLCSASDIRLTGSPIFSAGGAIALKSMLFYGAGIIGEVASQQPFSVNTQLAPYAPWIASVSSGGARNCTVVGVPPSTSTSSTSTDDVVLINS